MEVPQPQIAPVNAPRKPKGRYSLPMDPTKRLTGKPSPYAYTFKDPGVGEMAVLSTSSGWWSDSVKLQKLIDAYKLDANDDEACYYAGITVEQLRYFKDLHKDFYRLKHMCAQHLGLLSKKNLAKSIEVDTKGETGASLRYLMMKRKDEGYTTRQEVQQTKDRELYDGLAEEIRELGEHVRKHGETEKHTGGDAAGHADAGPNGSGNAAGASAA